MAQYTIKSRVIDNIIYVDTLDQNGNVVPDSMRFFEVTATTPEELQKEIERSIETVRNELGQSNELTPSLIVREHEQLGKSTDLKDFTPGKTAEVAATNADVNLEDKESYVTSGNSSTEAGVNQINEDLKTKPEPPKVEVTVNVPEQKVSAEKVVEKTNTVTKLIPEEKPTTVPFTTNEKANDKPDTPSSVVSEQSKKTKDDKSNEPVIIKNPPIVPVESQKEKTDDRPITSLTKEQAIIRYNIEHGLNSDGSIKTDKTNAANSSPAASSLAAAGEKPELEDKTIKFIQSSDDRFKLTDYQQNQGPAFLEKKLKEQDVDHGNSLSYITTPGAVVKTAAEPPSQTTEKSNNKSAQELLLKLDKWQEIGWLDKTEPLKPGETSKAVEKKEEKKDNEIPGKTEISNNLAPTLITTDLIKKPEETSKPESSSGTVKDPSLNKKDLLSKIFKEREKKKQQIEAIVKTASTGQSANSLEKSAHVISTENDSDQSAQVISTENASNKFEPLISPDVKVKTAKNKVTPEIAKGIMQNTPEAKGLAAVNEGLARVQSTLSTIGQTQIANANNTNTINNSTSNVKNEDNRKILQEERKLEKEKEKIDEKNIIKNPNQLTEFYLHGIYDALVSQGIKIKSY